MSRPGPSVFKNGLIAQNVKTMNIKRIIDLIFIFQPASRQPFLCGSLISVGLGTALAYRENGTIAWSLFLLTLTGIAGAHLAVNLLNDYFDYLYGADPAHPPRPLSGGSQVIQEGLETPAEYLAQALICGAVAAACALYVALLTGPFVFAPGPAGRAARLLLFRPAADFKLARLW